MMKRKMITTVLAVVMTIAMSATAFAASLDQNGGTAEPSAEQLATMENIAAEFGFSYDYYSDGKPEIVIADMSSDKMVHFLVDMISYLSYDTMSIQTVDNPDGYPFYWRFYDKATILSNVDGIFNKEITDSDIEAFNKAEGFEAIAVQGDKLGGTWDDGTWGYMADLLSSNVSGDEATVSVSYRTFDDSEPVIDSGTVTAIYRKNPASYFGYSLVSVKKD